MGQSLAKNYIHIIFSTKYRQPLIDVDIESELHAYLGAICKRLECPPIKIGGYTDHIHILCMISRKLSLSKLVEELKSHSSKWIKTKGGKYQNFYWQDGYGAFSVNPYGVNGLIKYISNQKSHHSKTNFQDEYREFLAKNEIAFNEKYLWE